MPTGHQTRGRSMLLLTSSSRVLSATAAQWLLTQAKPAAENAQPALSTSACIACVSVQLGSAVCSRLPYCTPDSVDTQPHATCTARHVKITLSALLGIAVLKCIPVCSSPATHSELSYAGGMVKDATFQALPSISPLICTLLVLFAQAPVLIAMTRSPRPELFPRAVVDGCLSRYALHCECRQSNGVKISRSGLRPSHLHSAVPVCPSACAGSLDTQPQARAIR